MIPNQQSFTSLCFFSLWLAPAEKNYDIGDQELLAVKLGLEQWHHWLSMVWPDHKNPVVHTFCQTTERQASPGVLFFSQFNFTPSYHPGSRNCKAAALSHQFYLTKMDSISDFILVSSIRLGATKVDTECEVISVLITTPAPSACLYVLVPLSFKVLHWCHSSHLSCHPG